MHQGREGFAFFIFALYGDGPFNRMNSAPVPRRKKGAERTSDALRFQGGQLEENDCSNNEQQEQPRVEPTKMQQGIVGYDRSQFDLSQRPSAASEGQTAGNAAERTRDNTVGQLMGMVVMLRK